MRKLDLLILVSYIFIKLETMKKPKNRSKLMAEQKRATKRSNRLKATRKKLMRLKEIEMDVKRAEKKKYEEFMRKLLEAKAKGEF